MAFLRALMSVKTLLMILPYAVGIIGVGAIAYKDPFDWWESKDEAITRADKAQSDLSVCVNNTAVLLGKMARIEVERNKANQRLKNRGVLENEISNAEAIALDRLNTLDDDWLDQPFRMSEPTD